MIRYYRVNIDTGNWGDEQIEFVGYARSKKDIGVGWTEFWGNRQYNEELVPDIDEIDINEYIIGGEEQGYIPEDVRQKGIEILESQYEEIKEAMEYA